MNGPRTTPPVYRRTLSIETKPAREGQKSRTFSVELLAWIVANDLWELGATSKDNTSRPVFMAFAGTHSAARAFEANLRCGRTAVEASSGRRFEIPRSAGFRFDSVNRGEGTLKLIYLPHVFSMQPPTTEDDTLSFLCMPPSAWVDEQAATIESAMGTEAREAAMAAYFVAYLDARTALPIANDLRFHLELYRAAREEAWCEVSDRETSPGLFDSAGLAGIGFEPATKCNVATTEFAEFLAQQTARLLPREIRQEVIHHGTTRIRRPRRLLPHSHAPSAQLSLFAEL